MTKTCLVPDMAESLNDWPARPTTLSPLFQAAFRITPTADQMRERYGWPEAFYPDKTSYPGHGGWYD